MRFCESCGNALQPKDQFCGKCGAPVKREDAKRGKEGKKKELKNKKAWIIGITVLVMCVAMSVVGVVVIKPYCEKLSDYKEAESLLKDGEYSKAYKTFEKLENFKNAESRQLECQYGMAGEYYRKKKFEEAREIYEQLGKYSDSEEWVTKCQYEIAKALYQENKYEDAIDAFNEIETYKDSKEQIQNCYYELGQEAYQTSDYDAAMSYLGKAPDVEKAKELYQMLEWRAAYIDLLGYSEDGFYYSTSFGNDDRQSREAVEYEKEALGISLAYIDQDNIPELIVYRIDGNHGDGCWIYTAIDGYAQKVAYGDFDDDDYRETFGSGQAIQVVPKSSLLCDTYIGGGSWSDNYYKLKDGKLELVVKLLGVDLDREEWGTGTAKYYVNDKKVSKEKYVKEQEKLDEEYGSDYKWVGNSEYWNGEDPLILLRDNDYSVEDMMDRAISTFCNE